MKMEVKCERSFIFDDDIIFLEEMKHDRKMEVEGDNSLAIDNITCLEESERDKKVEVKCDISMTINDDIVFLEEIKHDAKMLQDQIDEDELKVNPCCSWVLRSTARRLSSPTSVVCIEDPRQDRTGLRPDGMSDPYVCKKCNIKFKTKEIMQEHFHLSNKKCFKCEQCEKKFKTQCGLLDHKRAVHTGGKLSHTKLKKHVRGGHTIKGFWKRRSRTHKREVHTMKLEVVKMEVKVERI